VSAPGKVVVVGGGLAGITAAIALSEAGADVTLAEAKPRLGGATSSFSRGGLMVDTGQHVFLRCCVAYRGLLARLGMTGAVTLQDRFDVTVLAPGGRARLRRTALPGPLHLGKALLGYGFLSRAQRLSVARAALAMAALNPAREDLDRQRLGDWLAARGQDEQTRRLLWDLFTVSALNTAGDDANLALAATVVKTGLLGARDAADIGVPSIPLGQLHGQAAGALLTRLGAQVRLSAKVAGVEALSGGPGGQGARFLVRLAGRGGGDGSRPDGAGPGGAEPDGPEPDGAGPGGAERYTAGRHSAGQVIEADGVVLAVPAAVAARLAPAGAVPGSTVPGSTVPPGSVPANPDSGNAGPGPAQWRELSTSPIVNVHVMYDRRVTRLPFAAAVNSPVQWVFDRTGPSGLRSGQYLAVSLSAADDYVDVPASALRKQFLPAMADLFPAVHDARVTDFFVTRERRATLRQVPGCERLRPKAATALPGLVLAGAWTDTGWPDTMEGAVRSGLNAARTLRHGMAQGGVASPARPAVSAGPARDRSRTRRPTRRPGQVNGSAPVNTRNAVNARDAVDVPDAVNGPAGTGATA
jgi:Flavin containing amine oxidoreductase